MLHFSDPPEHSEHNVYLTAEEVVKIFSLWVRRLGLQAWQIELDVRRQADMPVTNAQGATCLTYALRRATIALLDPRDHRSGNDMSLKYDMETTLVHELLHIVLHAVGSEAGLIGHKEDTLYNTCIEQPIEQLSMALVALRRATETKRGRLGVWS